MVLIIEDNPGPIVAYGYLIKDNQRLVAYKIQYRLKGNSYDVYYREIPDKFYRYGQFFYLDTRNNILDAKLLMYSHLRLYYGKQKAASAQGIRSAANTKG